MLRVNASTSADAAKSYYTQGLSRQDYYTHDHGQEVVGHWHGRGAEMLGLSGEVDQESFFALADNVNPLTGETLTARQKSNRRVGYDFTFSAPKSVAVIYALTQDENILEAHKAAVKETMAEMEAEMKTRVRTGGQEEDRVTGNMVWGDFTHLSTRPVDGVPDPDLHTHAFVFNATWDAEEDRWKAGQFGDLKRDAGYYEAAFHARLSARMKELGFGVERQGKFWDIAGVSRSVIEIFSRRSAEIEAKAAELGVTDPAAKGALGAATRERKALDLSVEVLRSQWRGRLSESDRDALDAVIEQADAVSDSGGHPPDTPGILAESMQYAVDAAFERASVVSEKQLMEAALRRGVGAVLPEEVNRESAWSGQGVMTREMDGRRLSTTREVAAEEERMLAFAREGRGTCRSLGGSHASQYHASFLNPGQLEAVRHVLTSSDRVMMIQGGAGTGKTTLMREAVNRIEEGSGKQVFTFAPSADASRGVLREEGFGEADTVARLLIDEVLQRKLQHQVIWIDEAGLLGVRDMARVFDLADRLGARVILSGDTRQHASVARGDAMRLLAERAGVAPAETTEIMRQRGTYRDAVAALSKGEVESGFDLLSHLGCVREVPDEARHLLLGRDYVETVEADKTALVISPTHAEGEQVTKTIRTALREQGKIGAVDRPLFTLRNLSWGEAQKGDAASYRTGLVVQFFQNVPGIKRGDRFEVTGREGGVVHLRGMDGATRTLPLEKARQFQVFSPQVLKLAEGDRVRITGNGLSKDGHRLNNGGIYSVAEFNKAGDMVLGNGWVVGQDYGHLATGYYTTSHASQGKTVDRVFIAQGSESFAASSREQFYVSVSRGREAVTIYTDDAQALKAQVHRSGQRASATELLEGDVTGGIKPIPIEFAHKIRQERHQRWAAQRERVMADSMQHAMGRGQDGLDR